MIQPEPATAGPGAQEPGDLGSVFVANYPPFSAWRPEELPRVHAALAAPPRPGARLGLYLHIPFCRKRCRFCYFRVYTDKDAAAIESYLDALAAEVEAYAARPAVAGRPLTFVYFGGGTPSYLSARQLTRLVARLRAALPWDGVEEVTFECEPGTLTRSKLEAIRALGVTRLSLGVESFDDAVLRENGRAHSSREIDRVLPWIRALAFDQLNIDLIAGMVGETWESWRKTVRRTVDAAPDSVTIYQMELPFNTVYARTLLDGGGIGPLPDWPTKRAWHDEAFAALAAAGYALSSAYTMVRPRPQPPRFVYRDAVWEGSDLVGAGVASFSHLSGVHFQNLAAWGEYLGTARAGGLPLARALALDERERFTRETVLQLKRGRLPAAPLRAKYGRDILVEFAAAWAELAAAGMLRIGADEVELTRAGLLQVDRLLPVLYDARYRNVRYT